MFSGVWPFLPDRGASGVVRDIIFGAEIHADKVGRTVGVRGPDPFQCLYRVLDASE